MCVCVCVCVCLCVCVCVLKISGKLDKPTLTKDTMKFRALLKKELPQ